MTLKRNKKKKSLKSRLVKKLKPRLCIQQERQRAELARISADEEIAIAEENRLRATIVAAKSKERTDAVETERVEKDRGLEVAERERVVTLAQIEKEKAIEVEKKNIQDVIKDRVMVERTVVEEEEKIKDTREFAAADRKKQVAVTAAEEIAQQQLVKDVQKAEAEKQSAVLEAETVVVRAEAERSAAEKQTEAKKMLAEATQAEEAAVGLAEAQVTIEKAAAIEKEGTAEAKVAELKFQADAKGITEKAEAMKLFDGVGREHEEFKLNAEQRQRNRAASHRLSTFDCRSSSQDDCRSFSQRQHRHRRRRQQVLRQYRELDHCWQTS